MASSAAPINDSALSDIAICKYMGETHKGVEEVARVEISDSEANSFDSKGANGIQIYHFYGFISV